MAQQPSERRAVGGHNLDPESSDTQKEPETAPHTDAVKSHNPYSEGGDTKKDLDTAPPTGGDTAWNKCYRVTAVCVVLLCVLLLSAVTVLWIDYNILNTENIQLQTSYNNLTIERDQLQTSYNNLTIERDQLQTSYTNLTIERDQLQREKDEYLRKFCVLNKGKCFIFSSLYFMSNEEKSWTESREDCRDKGADLVVINSREEQTFISNQVIGNNSAWIGLSDKETEGKWNWVDSTPLNTEFWASGEPNDAGGDEDCVEIYGGANGNFYNDKKCSDNLNWICEKHH